MEPKLPTPHGSPEMGPPIITPELASQQGAEVQGAPEKYESHEQKPTGGDGSGSAYATPAPVMAPPIMPNPFKQAAPAPLTDTPAVAADEDVIEKEWVEKAKKVINETKHDPFLQEQAVSRLQADYIQKRYGKTVKLPEEV
ncbi:hypothetical protein H7Y40_02325 [Pedobacter sp.]|nr:hypothetical protein [Candidatus Saccharibacteria bacterium]